MGTASSSGNAVRDDRCRNTGAGDLSDCPSAMANTEPPDEEVHESEGFSSAPSTSFYHSKRIQGLIDAGSHGQSVQSEIENSKVTWTEPDNSTLSQTEALAEKNQKYFECYKRNKYGREADQIVAMELSKAGKPWNSTKERTEERMPYHALFRDYDTLIVGKKLAEGGQAEIYEASLDINEYKDDLCRGDTRPVVVKVFKADISISDLEKLWPLALVKKYNSVFDGPLHFMWVLEGATLLKDEKLLRRFAFVMPRYGGDLRKLIDHRMIHVSHNRGPPFPSDQIYGLMMNIALDMTYLHSRDPPILHRDLKAANVLVHEFDVGLSGLHAVNVADYDCSVGVVGTGFWRAPEILLQVKRRDSPLKITKECDVYSYGMTCYEIVTGRIPFEECSISEGLERVLNGERPELPMDLRASLKDTIVSCWHADPSKRPSFPDIVDKLTPKLPLGGRLDMGL